MAVTITLALGCSRFRYPVSMSLLCILFLQFEWPFQKVGGRAHLGAINKAGICKPPNQMVVTNTLAHWMFSFPLPEVSALFVLHSLPQFKWYFQRCLLMCAFGRDKQGSTWQLPKPSGHQAPLDGRQFSFPILRSG